MPAVSPCETKGMFRTDIDQSSRLPNGLATDAWFETGESPQTFLCLLETSRPFCENPSACIWRSCGRSSPDRRWEVLSG